jgi:hypothetical protein
MDLYGGANPQGGNQQVVGEGTDGAPFARASVQL